MTEQNEKLEQNIEQVSLTERYSQTRTRTESICAPLKIEDYVPQPAVFASPPKWHLAHTTWFFEQFILKSLKKGYRTFDINFNHLFNSYYKHHGDPWERSKRGWITRPGVERVYEYREYVDQHIRGLMSTSPSRELEELIEIGINHEEQHQELLISDLKYLLSLNPIMPKYSENRALIHDQNSHSGWHNVNGGLFQIGHNDRGFCYDNEQPRHQVYLEDFEIRRSLVTNKEFMEFIDDGGYESVNLWLDDGWNHINEKKIQHPLYWKKKDGRWYNYTLGGEKLIKPDDILCHISFYEAEAFARWAGYRLPTEFEWEVCSPEIDVGKRWEWTYSAYHPYPGYRAAQGALGEYNGKFMINQMVLRGSSVATTPGHSRNTYRNFFHPHLRWQFAGIRLAK